MNWLREPDTEPIPGYRLIEPLGTGGFGEVWKCEVPGGLFKAIKFVFGNLNSVDGDSAKAEQELRALDRVKTVRHPFVLTMERIEIVNGELLIVMELADRSMHDLMVEYQKAGRVGIPREVLLGLLNDAAEGLDHLNEKHNLQHLDVKPKNLFLIADRVKVADFGLVKHLERQSTSGIMGGITPVYAAPETFANKFSKHSDQYSLAVLYVELLTGQRPFGGKNIRQLALQHMTEAPDLSMLPEPDRAAVARAMSKEPEDRFPSCCAFVRALGGGSMRADLTQSLSSVETPPPAAAVRRVNATMPEMDLGTTQPVHLPPRRTPPPSMTRDVARFPTLPTVSSGNTVSMSVSFRPEEGVLRPAILIGIGSFGRLALQQVRCRLLDRVGELGHIPCFRFLYVDADPDAPRKAVSGSAEAALLPEHMFHIPLQPVTSYRRKQLDNLLEWLPREKLYSIPRNLRVEGSRALGRLAFCDHYLRFVNRFRHEVQVATHPEAIKQSSDQTGLTIRSKSPAVYILASASGGTSGMLLDLGHAVRRALEKLNVSDATVTSFVFAGAPEDGASPPVELSNIFATLTELNHYAENDVTFMAQYGGPEGPQVEAKGLPFDATYLLPMRERSVGAFRDCLSHLAGYVAHDLTTPLGTGLEQLRKKPAPFDRTPFRGFGTFGVWYPRGLLLRSAARQLCVRFLRTWAEDRGDELIPEAEGVLHHVLTDARLNPEEIQRFIAAEANPGADGNPVEKLRLWGASLAAQADAGGKRNDPASWADATWDHARDWVGLEPTTEADSHFRRGRLSRALDGGLKTAVEAWENELTELLRPLDELSGPRISSGENVINQLIAASAAAAASLEKLAASLEESRNKQRIEVQNALEACHDLDASTGFALFGGRVTRTLRGVAEKVRAFAETRIREDLAMATIQFYRRLQVWFEEKLRDLREARDRLGNLATLMEAYLAVRGNRDTPSDHSRDRDESMQTTLHASNTTRVVLPYGEDHLDRSAAEMLAKLSPEERRRLELILTRLVVEPRGGLTGAARGSSDLLGHLAAPMIEQATAFLTNLLPTEDVTAVELSAAGPDQEALVRRVASHIRGAAPLASGPTEEERTFVMIPDTEAGEVYAEAVKTAAPAATTVQVPGTTADLLFCREQSCLRTSDLFRFLEPCWEAYHEAANDIENNPHSRFDVTGWVPLVE